MPNLYLITGPAGVGKSTIKIYFEKGFYVIFNYIITPENIQLINDGLFL